MTTESPRATRAVVSSHPLATAACHLVLDANGSAVDAAVAGAAVLTVVDPRSTGIAGDLFATVWPAGAPAPIGLNAAGPAPGAMTMDALRAAGYTSMPQAGPWSVTVPGAVAGWRALLTRYGRTPLAELLAPAIAAATDGFQVSPAIAREWASAVAKLRNNAAASDLFLVDDRSPAEGDLFANPEYGRLLERLAERGLDDFYDAEIAGRLAAAVAELGGPLAAEDIIGWDGIEWVTPLTVAFGDLTLHELPPPGQGLVALIAAAVYRERRLGDRVLDTHIAVESLRRAFADGHASIADPLLIDVPVEALLDSERLADLAAAIDLEHASAGRVGPASNTVFLAVVGDDGEACSLIQSLYDGFGSGIVVPGLGIPLQNRAGSFDLIDGHPNSPAPGKRPYHTIIPAMLSREGRFAGCLGVVGGFMQPQGHLQVLRNVVDLGMTPQEAVDAPRFRLYSGARVAVEAGFDETVAAGLRARGHEVDELPTFEAGGAQLILSTPEGMLVGSDRRKDGRAS